MKLITASLAIVLMATAANAAVIAEWTFEVSVPASAGPFAPETGAGEASGWHANSSVVYSNPVGNGSDESYSSNYWSAGDYYQFKVSTLGYTNIQISWDQAASSTGPQSFALQYSTDGFTFINLVPSYTVLVNTTTQGPPARSAWSSTGTRQSVYTLGPIAGPASLDNKATVYFRMASLVTTATAGTNRVDNVLIEGVPEPMTMALLGLGALAMLRRRK